MDCATWRCIAMEFQAKRTTGERGRETYLAHLADVIELLIDDLDGTKGEVVLTAAHQRSLFGGTAGGARVEVVKGADVAMPSRAAGMMGVQDLDLERPHELEVDGLEIVGGEEFWGVFDLEHFGVDLRRKRMGGGRSTQEGSYLFDVRQGLDDGIGIL